MICVSLAETPLLHCLAALEKVPFAEIRMDRMHLSPADVRALFSRHPNLIATCRPGVVPDHDRKTLLVRAIESGAAFVDVEVEAPAGYRKEIVARARAYACRVIISFHDYENTPLRRDLERVVAACFQAGGDIAKIACRVRSLRDNARLLGLLDDEREIVVVGMGEEGRITRIAAPLLGSPFTFASLSTGKETAEGQMDKETLEAIICVLVASAGLEEKPHE